MSLNITSQEKKQLVDIVSSLLLPPCNEAEPTSETPWLVKIFRQYTKPRRIILHGHKWSVFRTLQPTYHGSVRVAEATMGWTLSSDGTDKECTQNFGNRS
jgi:hypothetical protein